MESVEKKVVKTILQQPQEIMVAGDVMYVAPPSVATLILVSEETVKLPHIELDKGNIVMETLSVAKECRALGDIVAILILGAKGLTEEVIVEKKRFFGFLKTRTKLVVDTKAVLAKKLIEDTTPKELHELAIKLLSSLQISDFFGLTTSLIEVNLLRQTKGVVNKTIASGL